MPHPWHHCHASSHLGPSIAPWTAASPHTYVRGYPGTWACGAHHPAHWLPPPAGFLEATAPEFTTLVVHTLGLYHDKRSRRAVESVVDSALASDAFLKSFTAALVKLEASRPNKQVGGNTCSGALCSGSGRAWRHVAGPASWLVGCQLVVQSRGSLQQLGRCNLQAFPRSCFGTGGGGGWNEHGIWEGWCQWGVADGWHSQRRLWSNRLAWAKA